MSDTWAIRRLVSQIKEHWRTGETPDAEAALEAHPHLRRWKSIVLDLAFEEFHLRSGEGQPLGADEFCRRFPEHQRSLLHRIEIEQYLEREAEQRAIRWPKEGDEFLGYRLLEELGKGAVGRVFLAQQLAMRDRLVVVKVTPLGKREADTLALLNHPNIVPVYRCDEDPATGLAAICMPYVGRVTMEDLLVAAQDGVVRDFPSLLAELQRRFPDAPPPVASDRRPPSSHLEGMIEIGRQIAEALAHTHTRGVLHLDLKPSNVLLLSDGSPLLLDFNLSVEGPIGASVIGGTLPYMSPEQLQEAVLGRSYSSRPVDGRSDVFSLGVILYELIAGRHPFGEIRRTRDPREAAKELLRRHERGPAPWPEAVQVDREVVRFLDACLAYHPGQRPQSAGDAAASLRRFLSPRFRLRRWAKQRRKTVAALGAAAAIVMIAIGAAVALAPPESERRLQAAQVHLDRQEWPLAEAELKDAIGADPQSALAWRLLGDAQFQQERHRDAFASYRSAYELCKDPRLLEELGDCKASEKEHVLAVRWYQEAMRLGVQSPELYEKLGDSQTQMNQHVAAQANLNQAVRLAPTSTAAMSSRMKAALNESQQSREDISATALQDAKAICRDPDSNMRDLVAAAATFARAKHPAQFEEDAKTCLVQARSLGLEPEKLRGASVFKPYAEKAWFKALLADEAPAE